jgi:hypothetical protein
MFDNLSFSGHGAVAKNCEASAVDRGLGNRRIRPPVKEAPKRHYLIHSSARDCADLGSSARGHTVNP